MFAVKILNLLESLIRFICTTIMAGIVTVLFYAVVMRYIFHRPPAWSMELSRYSFLWMIMLCSVLVTREDSHIRMTFMLDLLPPKLRFIWASLLRLMMIGFCYVMVRYGLGILPIVAEAKSPTLGVSMGWMYLAIPVGGLLMALYFLELMVRSFVLKEWSVPDGVD